MKKEKKTPPPPQKKQGLQKMIYLSNNLHAQMKVKRKKNKE